jgi:hypothetical protein
MGSTPMSEEASKLILGHLRHIRGRVDQLADDMGTVELRLSSSSPRLPDCMATTASRINAWTATRQESSESNGDWTSGKSPPENPCSQ